MKFFFFFLLFSIQSYPQKKATFSEGIYLISSYIAASDFDKITTLNESLSVVDSIYLFALKTFDYDYSETLFCLSFATLPYNSIPMESSLLNIKIPVYLPSPDDSTFNLRLDKLPKYFFHDSPSGKFGDKDKISHFFGNAFLAYNGSFLNLSKFAGIFVEMFETAFKIDGSMDIRDLRTNSLGEIFGDCLIYNKNLFPSDILKLYSLFFGNSLINIK